MFKDYPKSILINIECSYFVKNKEYKYTFNNYKQKIFT